MSKIFEALRMTEGATKNIAMPLLTQEEQELCAQVSAPAPVEERQVVPPVAEPQEQEPSGSHIRTEAIHLRPGSPILPFDGTDSRASEQYRIIRTKIGHHPERPRVVLVSSPIPGDGKTISAINLAGSLAFQEGENVLLVDGDFRRSSVARSMGIDYAPGLSEVLHGTVSLESALIRTEQIPNLYVLPAGDSTVGAAELLATDRWRSLVDLFRKQFGYVVFDAPPIGSVADYDLLQLSCDGVVMVIRQDHTNRTICERALGIVPKSKRLGVILNCVDDWFLWKTQSYYYYSRKVKK